METTWAYAHLAKPPSLKRLSQPLLTVAEKKYGMSAEKIQNVFKKFPIVIPKWNDYKS